MKKYDILELGKMTTEQLAEIAVKRGVTGIFTSKQPIIYAILDKQVESKK